MIWQGAVTGGIVAGLNHVVHYKNFAKYYSKKPKVNRFSEYHENYENASTLKDWVNANKSKSQAQLRKEVQGQGLLNSQSGGPNMRYVFHPISGRIIDMRHYTNFVLSIKIFYYDQIVMLL